MRIRWGVLLGVAAVSACADSPTNPAERVEVGSVQITSPAPSVAVGGSLKLSAVVLDAAGATLSGLTVAWSSLDPGRAAVSDDGVLTGVGPGTVRVAALVSTTGDTISLAVLGADMAVDTILLGGEVSPSARGNIAAVQSLVDSAGLGTSGTSLVVPDGTPVFATNSTGDVLFLGEGLAGPGPLGSQSTALTILMMFFPEGARPGVTDDAMRAILVAHPSFAPLASTINTAAALNKSFSSDSSVAVAVADMVRDVAVDLRPELPAAPSGASLRAPVPFPVATKVDIDDSQPGPDYRVTNHMFVGFGMSAQLASNGSPIGSVTLLDRRQISLVPPSVGAFTVTQMPGADDEVVVSIGPNPLVEAEHCQQAVSDLIDLALSVSGQGLAIYAVHDAVVAEVFTAYGCGASPTPTGVFTGVAQALIGSPATLTRIAAIVYVGGAKPTLTLLRSILSFFTGLSEIQTGLQVVAAIPFWHDWLLWFGWSESMTVCQIGGEFSPCVESIELTPGPSLSIEVGDLVQVTAVTRDVAGSVLPWPPSWTSSDPNTVEVTSNGAVNALAEGGPVTINATAGRQSASVEVTVVGALSSLEVVPSSWTLAPAGQKQLAALAYDAEGHPITSPTVTWRSTGESVATVDQDGLVTGIAPGITSILAESKGKQADAQVTVVSLIWDATADFSLSSNPSGQWSSGWTSSLGSAFVLYPTTSSGAGGAYVGWVDPTILIAGTPTFAKNVSGSTVNGVPPGFVSLHPGCSVGEYSELRWTATIEGSYLVDIQFFAGDSGNTDAAVLVNGGEPLFATASTSGNPSFLSTLSLAVGDRVQVTVGTGGDGCYSDNTPIAVTISLQ